MRDVDLFQLALGIERPWRVERTEFDAEQKRLDLYIDFEPGGMFECPICGRGGCKAWDTTDKEWRHLNFFQHQAYLHVRTPRVKCPEHGVKLVEVPWGRHGSGFTLLFEAFVLALAEAMPLKAVARIVGEHDTRLWRIVHHYVERARAEADFSAVTTVGIDETSRKRGHQYVSLFMDLVGSRVLFATEGRASTVFDLFREDLETHGASAEQVRELCMDMSPAYILGARKHFPGAEITFDKFHVMKLINEAIDAVRRAEQKERPELKRSRYIWLKNRAKLKPSESKLLESLLPETVGLQTAQAYQIKLSFQKFWDLPRHAAAEYLDNWIAWARASGLDAMIRVANTIELRREGVLNWFWSRVSNGLLEGIASLVQAAKAKARGYRSTRNLIAIIYLLAGKLDHRPLPI